MAAKIAAYKASLTEEQKALHRQSFIHFAKCLAGNSPEIFAATVDGKQYKGVYNTMTPFPGEDFRVCVRSSMAVVSTWFIMGAIGDFSSISCFELCLSGAPQYWFILFIIASGANLLHLFFCFFGKILLAIFSCSPDTS
jgi:hypothetical protein